MIGFVYLWFDRKHKRFYLGKHWGEEDDGYVCSSKWMKRAYDRRPEDFKRRILQRVTERDELGNAEDAWGRLIKEHELHDRYYNIRRPGLNQWHDDPDQLASVSEKISRAHKKRARTPEGLAQSSKGGKTCWAKMGPDWAPTRGAILSDDHKYKLSKALKGNMNSKGHVATLESNEKRSATLKGRKKQQVTCPNCGREGPKPSMIRWHFENCKATR